VNLTVIRAAFAAQVAALASPSLRTLAEPEDQINPPVGIVMPGRPYVVYGSTLQGETGFGPVLGPAASTPLSETNFNLDFLIVLSHASTLERVEQNLDAWLGVENDGTAVSVAAAVGADPTLSGTVRWCEPMSADPPGPLAWNGPEAFGTRIHFQLSAL
jgi:hypothetical protein